MKDKTQIIMLTIIGSLCFTKTLAMDDDKTDPKTTVQPKKTIFNPYREFYSSLEYAQLQEALHYERYGAYFRGGRKPY